MNEINQEKGVLNWLLVFPMVGNGFNQMKKKKKKKNSFETVKDFGVVGQ